MAQIPSVCIDPHINLTTEISDVHIPVALVGVEVEGCAYRMDNVPMRCRKVVNPPQGMLTDEELLEKIYVRLCEIMGDA
jgi:formylmethanofuran dehydrogenase subunit B